MIGKVAYDGFLSFMCILFGAHPLTGNSRIEASDVDHPKLLIDLCFG